MAIYDVSGAEINGIFDYQSQQAYVAYDRAGEDLFPIIPRNKYTSYTSAQYWSMRGPGNAQGFDVYDGKVFWVSKAGNDTADANCYVYNLSDGSQALTDPYITIYSGHGNNICFDWPLLYATSAYNTKCYVNSMTDDFTATLEKTLLLSDGSGDCDACIDDTDNTKLWTIGHNGSTGPYNISLWDLTDQTQTAAGLYVPKRLHTVQSPLPANTHYFQGCKFHDGILWYANGYPGTSIKALVIGIHPYTGEVLYTIDTGTTAEPEGIAWIEDETSYGGYALYVGMSRMAMYKVTFSEPST